MALLPLPQYMALLRTLNTTPSCLAKTKVVCPPGVVETLVWWPQRRHPSEDILITLLEDLPGIKMAMSLLMPKTIIPLVSVMGIPQNASFVLSPKQKHALLFAMMSSTLATPLSTLLALGVAVAGLLPVFTLLMLTLMPMLPCPSLVVQPLAYLARPHFALITADRPMPITVHTPISLSELPRVTKHAGLLSTPSRSGKAVEHEHRRIVFLVEARVATLSVFDIRQHPALPA